MMMISDHEDQIQNKSYFKKLEYLYSIYKKQKQSTKGEE